MVTISSIRSTKQLPGTLGQPQASPQAFGSQVGGALARAGQTITQVSQKFEKANQSRKLSEIKTQFTRDVNDFAFQLQSNPDGFETWDRDLQDFIDQRRGQLTAGIVDTAVLGEFDRAATNVEIQTGFNIRSAARKRLIDVGRADLKQAKNVYSDLFAQQTTDIGRENARNEYFIEVENAQNAGFLTKQEAVIKRDSFEQDSAIARVRNDLTSAPEEAQDMLLNNDYGLNPENNAIWSERARIRVKSVLGERVRLAEKAEQNAEKELKTDQDALYAAYSVTLQENGRIDMGKFTSDFIEGKMSQSQFDSMTGKVDRQGLGGDEAEKERLSTSIQLGDNVAVIDIQNNALLDATQENELIKELQLFENKEFRENFSQGKAELKSAIITTGPLANLMPGQSERLVLAENILKERLEAGESLNEIINGKNGLKARFRTGTITINTLPVPRFGQKPASLQEVESQQKDLLKKIDILRNPDFARNFQELNREAELLEAYKQIFSVK